MAIMLESDIVVSEFELQSSYEIHFRANTLEKDRNSLIHELSFK